MSLLADDLRYYGANHLTVKVVCSLLSGREFKVSAAHLHEGGWKAHEISFLHLIDAITDGSVSTIDESNTELTFTPGTITGCKDATLLETDQSVGLGYYILPLLMIGPFSKYGLQRLRLTGQTHPSVADNTITLTETDQDAEEESNYSAEQLSCDYIRVGIVQNMAKLVSDLSNVRLQVIRRRFGNHPGLVELTIPPVVSIPVVSLTEVGRIDVIRGSTVSIGTKKEWAVAMSRLIKNDLGKHCDLVHVYTDTVEVIKNNDPDPANCGLRGFGITLHAMSTETKVSKAAEYYVHQDDYPKLTQAVDQVRALLGTGTEDEETEDEGPKDWKNEHWVAFLAESRLLAEILRGGYFDVAMQPMVLLFMALASEEGLCKIRLGRLSRCAEVFVRHVQDFFGVVFDLVDFEEEESNEQDTKGLEGSEEDETVLLIPTQPSVILRCVGLGYMNSNMQRADECVN